MQVFYLRGIPASVWREAYRPRPERAAAGTTVDLAAVLNAELARAA
jgi:hypothetical protein